MRGAPVGSEVGLRLRIRRDLRPIEVGDVIESRTGLVYLVDSIRQGPIWYSLRVVKLDPGPDELGEPHRARLVSRPRLN